MHGRTWKSLLMFALAMAAMIQGCNCGPAVGVSTEDDDGSTTVCGSATDCAPGETCTNGACVAVTDGSTGNCTADAGCPADQVCSNGTCISPGDGGTGGGNDGGTGASGDGGPSDGGPGGSADGGSDGCLHDDDCGDDMRCRCGTCVCDDDDGEDDASCGDRKSMVCHVPPGHPSNAHTICVSNGSVGAHLGHGDSLGECPEADEADACENESEPDHCARRYERRLDRCQDRNDRCTDRCSSSCSSGGCLEHCASRLERCVERVERRHARCLSRHGH